MAYDVFISYSSKNKPTADAVCAAVEAKGARCWIAPRDILPGREWSEVIIDAIAECRVMIVVFSSSANESQQVKREAERAINKGATLIPVRIEDVYPSGAMEYYLSTSHWLDALSPPMEQHLEQLATTVQLLLAAPTTRSPNPDPGVPPKLPAPPPGLLGGGAGAPPGAGAGAMSAGHFNAANLSAAPLELPAELQGFNWGAFLLNRGWLNAHYVRLGFLAGLVIAAPYVGIVLGLIFGLKSKLAWLGCAGILAWVMLGVQGNRWAWQNRRWINPGHFRKVQQQWLLKGLAFWILLGMLGALFVKTGMNRKVAAILLHQTKNPELLHLKNKLQHNFKSKVKSPKS